MRIIVSFRFIIIVFFASLSACTPTSYVYVKKYQSPKPQISKVLIMIESLAIKDDIVGYWNFSEEKNLQLQDQLYSLAVQALKGKNYSIDEAFLKSSGLITDRNFLVDHYVNGKKLTRPIAPPYILRSVGLDDSNIQGLEVLLAELNRPTSRVMNDLRSYIKNNFQEQMQGIEVPKNTAILILQVYKPRLTGFAEFGFSPMNNDAFLQLSMASKAITQAYFLHHDTGDLIWSNKTGLLTAKNNEKFFLQLPAVKLVPKS